MSKDILDNSKFLWIKSYVEKSFMAECGALLCLGFFYLYFVKKKKKVSAKISFLNIHKIASYPYCLLSGVRRLLFPLTLRRLQRVCFSDIWHHIRWICDCFFTFLFPLSSVHVKYAWVCLCANKYRQLTIVSEMTQFLLDLPGCLVRLSPSFYFSESL